MLKFKLKPSELEKTLCDNKEGLKTLENLILNIDADFEKNLLIINDKKFKVISDNEFIYKIQKTQIKAINGIKGLFNEIEKASHDDFWNNKFYKMLYRVYTNVKEQKK